MATYAIGDIHGCFDELQLLLKKFSFNREQDILWFTGDLVNGGHKSIETLQFIKNLGEKAICVLGNHDLTLLGIASGKIKHSKDSSYIESILTYSQKDELLAWLQSRPLIHYDQALNILLVHAGLAPQWSIEKALALAKEVETILQDKQQALDFFANMFGNNPTIWDDNLTGWERVRCITNYLTRLRFCSKTGQMDLLEKGPSHKDPLNMMPWYAIPNRASKSTKIIFGHWAALIGKTDGNNVVALDTGCIWGNYLSAIRLEDHCIFTIKSHLNTKI